MNKYFSTFLLLFFASIVNAATPIKTNVSASYIYDDNVTRAELDRDIEKDAVLNVGASAAYKIPINEISYFSLSGTLDVNENLDFSKLSNVRLGAHGSYHLRLSSGYTATRYFAKLSFISRMYDSNQREGSATEIELGLSKRLTDLVSLRAGFLKEEIDSDEVRGVFDADNNRLYLDVGYKLTDKNKLYVTLGYVDGDVVSTAQFTSKILGASNAVVRDDAFLDLTPARFAYKLGAKTTSLRIGDSYALASRQAIDGSILYYDTAADGGNDYTGLIANLSYLYRF